MKTTLVTIFCIFLLSSCYQTVGTNLQRRPLSAVPDIPPNAEPGKCYAKSLVADQWSENSVEIPVYIGDENDNTVERELKEYVLIKENTKWVKRKADRNCISQNPDDCLVWCLVEIPEKRIERMVVLDTSDSSSFKMETIVMRDLEKKGGFSEWFEVLCEKDVDKSVISDLQNRLFVEQFLTEIPESIEFNALTKSALKEYQRKHNLPIGNLDFTTLTHMGVDY